MACNKKKVLQTKPRPNDGARVLYRLKLGRSSNRSFLHKQQLSSSRFVIYVIVIVIVIVISKLLKRYSKAKRTRAPAYSKYRWPVQAQSTSIPDRVGKNLRLLKKFLG